LGLTVPFSVAPELVTLVAAVVVTVGGEDVAPDANVAEMAAITITPVISTVWRSLSMPSPFIGVSFLDKHTGVSEVASRAKAKRCRLMRAAGARPVTPLR